MLLNKIIIFDYFQMFLMDFIYLFPMNFFQLHFFSNSVNIWARKCSLHENGVEFHQELIGNVSSGITRQKCV